MTAAIRELKWGDQTVDFNFGDGLSQEEQRAVEERMRAIDLLLKDENRSALYKLEVLFNRGRSFHAPFPGVVTWWHNGNKLHGGGDSKIYICPGNERKRNGCQAFLCESTAQLNLIPCGACGSLWRGSEVWGETYYNLPMKKWADVLLSWFVRMGLDADIRIKYARDDIRGAAMREQEKRMDGELLRKVRSEDRRSSSIYPLAHIIKDTSAGAGLHSRILAFLKA
jgi:hypothetical protein